MKRRSVNTAIIAGVLAAMRALAGDPSAGSPPGWAYPVDPPAADTANGVGSVSRHVPNSRAVYTNAQVNDLFVAPDWHPEEHPPAPTIVTRGRAPDVYPCGHCHRMTGSGGPENARLSGLPAAYILQQLADYRHGLRTTALPSRFPPIAMIGIAKALRPREMEAAAEYFARQVSRPTIHVVEAAAVPRTHVDGWRLAIDDGGGREPIGQRIIEVADAPEDFKSRDTHATFTAFVPPGSLARGRLLATSGANAASLACSICHGAQLEGLGVAPPIAGRSPSYLMRQLYEIQTGIRAGANAAPMKAAIAGLTQTDLIAVSAWTASL